jgi:hypothetical protein
MNRLFRAFSRREIKISGYMIVRDVVFHGYPYLEAIRSALPLCDEFLVADGCSTDETWKGLQALKQQFPEKVHLFQEPWQGETSSGEILATMSNHLRKHCRGKYCFNLQANEIIPRASIPFLVRLPELFLQADLFRLPFQTVMGRHLIWINDFRNRMFRNHPEIISLSDAYDVGYAPGTEPIRPRMDALTVHLNRPIVRYRGLYPVEYVRKLETRLRLFQSPHIRNDTQKEFAFAQETLKKLRAKGNAVREFWQEVHRFFDQVYWEDNPPGWRSPFVIPRHPLGFAEVDDGQLSHLEEGWVYPFAQSLNCLRQSAPVL